MLRVIIIRAVYTCYKICPELFPPSPFPFFFFSSDRLSLTENVQMKSIGTLDWYRACVHFLRCLKFTLRGRDKCMPSLNLGQGFNTVCYTRDSKPLSTLIKHENKMVAVTLIRCICEQRHTSCSSASVKQVFLQIYLACANLPKPDNLLKQHSSPRMAHVFPCK